MEKQINVSGTQVYIFYALKMGTEYEKHSRLHSLSSDIRGHDLQREELLIRYPEKWAEKMLETVHGGRKGKTDKIGGNKLAKQVIRLSPKKDGRSSDQEGEYEGIRCIYWITDCIRGEETGKGSWNFGLAWKLLL